MLDAIMSTLTATTRGLTQTDDGWEIIGTTERDFPMKPAVALGVFALVPPLLFLGLFRQWEGLLIGLVIGSLPILSVGAAALRLWMRVPQVTTLRLTADALEVTSGSRTENISIAGLSGASSDQRDERRTRRVRDRDGDEHTRRYTVTLHAFRWWGPNGHGSIDFRAVDAHGLAAFAAKVDAAAPIES